MNINNATSNVNSTAKSLLYSYIPFGSEYVIYSESNGVNNQYNYVMYLKKPFADVYEVYEVERVSSTNNTYKLTKGNNVNADEITVSNPYYSYSNIEGQGIRESLPIHNEIIAFSILILSSLIVVKTLVGGVFKWGKRKY